MMVPAEAKTGYSTSRVSDLTRAGGSEGFLEAAVHRSVHSRQPSDLPYVTLSGREGFGVVSGFCVTGPRKRQA